MGNERKNEFSVGLYASIVSLSMARTWKLFYFASLTKPTLANVTISNLRIGLGGDIVGVQREVCPDDCGPFDVEVDERDTGQLGSPSL